MIFAFVIALAGLAAADIGYIPVNQGWTAVGFAGVGETTQYGTNFGLCNGTVTIGIPDCTGFQLDVTLSNGTVIGSTPALGSITCPGVFNSTNPPVPANWTATEFTVPYSGAEVFNFTTVTGEAGTYLGLRFDQDPLCAFPLCTAGSVNFMYVPGNYTFAQAADACEAQSMVLANINIGNFLEATQVLYTCGGAGSQAFVASWNGDSYQGVPLTLDSSWTSPVGGAITVPAVDGERGAMCERVLLGQQVFYA